MKIAETSIKHPITVIMIFMAIGVLGFMSLSRLGLELFPDITFPSVVIYTGYPGVGTKEVESGVTKPLENALASLNGVKEISSTSSEGISMIIINMQWGTNMDTIVSEVREKIAVVENDLPEGSYTPVIIRFNPEQLPTLTFNVSTVTQDIDMRKMVEDEIVPDLQKIPGVATVDVYGGRQLAVTCKLKLDAIAKMDISILQILKIFQGENINLPGGSISLEKKYIVLRTIGEFQSVQDIGDVLVGYNNQVPVFLRDVANIKLDYLPQTEFVRNGSSQGVQVSTRKQTGHNTVKVNEKVKETLEVLRKKLPPSLSVNITYDQSKSILESIGGVVDSATQGGLLAILALLFFLRNIRSTLIISIAIPVSIIATFSLMDFGHISLNILSLMGMTLGVGMFVDNSIVVLESIYRKYLSGMNPMEAAEKGTSEVGLAIIASTLTTLVVFLPLIFVEGIAGMLFKDLAFTICYALFMSLVMAMTLIPVLSAKFLKIDKNSVTKEINEDLSLADVEVHTGIKFIDKIALLIQHIIQGMDNGYEKILLWALSHAKTVIISALVMFVLSISSIVIMGMEFLPEADEGSFIIDLETRIGTPFNQTEAKVIQTEEIVKEVLKKDLNALSSSIGSKGSLLGAGSGSHVATLRVKLIDRNLRKRDIWTIINEISDRLKKELVDTKFNMAIQGMSSLVSTATGGADALVVEVNGEDLTKSFEFAKKIAGVMNAAPGTRDVKVNHEEGKPELQFVIKRKEAVSLGLSPYEIAATIRTAYKGTEVSRFSDGEDDYDIIVVLDDKDRNDLSRITNLFFINQMGTKIPLENVVKITEAEGALSISRQNRTRQITVSAALTGEIALNKVMGNIKKKVSELGLPPTGIKVTYSGASEEMNSSYTSLMWAFILSMALVYMVMASQFESLLHPLIIMFSIPFAIVGMIVALLITNTTFSIVAFIGAILLVGVVVNNAIILVDYMNQLQKRGVGLKEAIVHGCKTRLKPILMTSLTTILGLIPMAIGMGNGAELQAPIGRGVLGGLTTSTLVTLVLIPTIYWLIESRRKRSPK